MAERKALLKSWRCFWMERGDGGILNADTQAVRAARRVPRRESLCVSVTGTHSGNFSDTGNRPSNENVAPTKREIMTCSRMMALGSLVLISLLDDSGAFPGRPPDCASVSSQFGG